MKNVVEISLLKNAGRIFYANFLVKIPFESGLLEISYSRERLVLFFFPETENYTYLTLIINNFLILNHIVLYKN